MFRSDYRYNGYLSNRTDDRIRWSEEFASRLLEYTFPVVAMNRAYEIASRDTERQRWIWVD